MQDAVVEALRHWRADGIPDKPGAWLQVAARRNALDRLRRRQRHEKALDRLRSDGVPAGGRRRAGRAAAAAVRLLPPGPRRRGPASPSPCARSSA